MDEVRAEVEGFDRKAREFYALVEDVMATAASVAGPVLVSPALVEAVREGVRRVQEAHRQAVEEMQELIARAGDPGQLRHTADGWSGIGAALGVTAGEVGLDRMQANLEWQGRAAEAYKALVPAQAGFVGTVREHCDAVATSLHTYADQLDSFWTAIKAAAVVMAAGLVTAMVTAATAVGIPAACVAILTAITAGATMVVTAVVQVEQLSTRIATEQRGMEEAMFDTEAGWPVPNTDAMADASAADGDGSDWRPNR
ncbi:hypothetical protein [Actinomycetospora flava]|uniref:Type VII secretion system (Wss) protein ESAT-6 n=1 Tax=Actinomycetospora flava TaxID=3129232 RepID=A0ABU8M525_9PSEU